MNKKLKSILIGLATIALMGFVAFPFANSVQADRTTDGGGANIGGLITGGTSGSVLFVGAGGVLSQDNSNFFWDDTTNFLGIGTTSPAEAGDFRGVNTRSAAVFAGTGINNLTAGGTYTGTLDHSYDVTINSKANLTYGGLALVFQVGETVTAVPSGATAVVATDNGVNSMTINSVTGTFAAADVITGSISGATATIATAQNTDTYVWSKDGIQVTAAGIPLTLAAQALDEGVTATFASVSGHDSGDNWTITTTAEGYVRSKSGYKVNGNLFGTLDGGRNVLMASSAGWILNPAVAVDNIIIGENAGNSNYSGTKNIFMGPGAGSANTSGVGSVFLGNTAGFSNNTGGYNIFLGSEAGYSNTSSTALVYIGLEAGKAATGQFNTFLGAYTGANGATGDETVLVGYSAGLGGGSSKSVAIGFESLPVGAANETVAIGYKSGNVVSSADFNTYVGSRSGITNQSGEKQVAIGYNAQAGTNTADDNTVVGANAGAGIGTGTDNTFLGVSAGATGGAGSRNTLIGANTDQESAGSNGAIALGEGAIAGTSEMVAGSTTSPLTAVYFGNGKTNSAAGSTVTISASGGVGTDISGGSITLSGGQPTGSGSAGSVYLATATPGATGTTVRNRANRLEVDSNGNLRAFTLHDNATAQGNANQQDIRSGTYTPTLTGVLNVTASTPRKAQWSRVGNVVTVSGQFDITPTGIGQVQIGISLPVASNFGTAYECGGAGLTTVNSFAAGVYGDAANNRAELTYFDLSGIAETAVYTFTYEVI